MIARQSSTMGRPAAVWPLLLAVVGSWCIIAPRAVAQQPSGDRALAEFLSLARVAAESFQEANRAAAAGYRPVDARTTLSFRYWIHPGHIVHGVLDPRRPSALLFSEAYGRPVLAGIAFILQVEKGSEAPPGPIPSELWRFQAGGIGELADSAPGGPGTSWPAAEAGLAIAHVSVNSSNPDRAHAVGDPPLPHRRTRR